MEFRVVDSLERRAHTDVVVEVAELIHGVGRSSRERTVLSLHEERCTRVVGIALVVLVLTAFRFAVGLEETEAVDHEEFRRDSRVEHVFTRFPRVDDRLSLAPGGILLVCTAIEFVTRFVTKPSAVEEVSRAPLVDGSVGGSDDFVAHSVAAVDIRDVAKEDTSLHGIHEAFPLAEVAMIHAVESRDVLVGGAIHESVVLIHSDEVVAFLEHPSVDACLSVILRRVAHVGFALRHIAEVVGTQLG